MACKRQVSISLDYFYKNLRLSAFQIPSKICCWTQNIIGPQMGTCTLTLNARFATWIRKYEKKKTLIPALRSTNSVSLRSTSQKILSPSASSSTRTRKATLQSSLCVPLTISCSVSNLEQVLEVIRKCWLSDLYDTKTNFELSAFHRIISPAYF